MVIMFLSQEFCPLKIKDLYKKFIGNNFTKFQQRLPKLSFHPVFFPMKTNTLIICNLGIRLTLKESIAHKRNVTCTIMAGISSVTDI